MAGACTLWCVARTTSARSAHCLSVATPPNEHEPHHDDDNDDGEDDHYHVLTGLGPSDDDVVRQSVTAERAEHETKLSHPQATMKKK